MECVFKVCVDQRWLDWFIKSSNASNIFYVSKISILKFVQLSTFFTLSSKKCPAQRSGSPLDRKKTQKNLKTWKILKDALLPMHTCIGYASIPERQPAQPLTSKHRATSMRDRRDDFHRAESEDAGSKEANATSDKHRTA